MSTRSGVLFRILGRLFACGIALVQPIGAAAQATERVAEIGFVTIVPTAFGGFPSQRAFLDGMRELRRIGSIAGGLDRGARVRSAARRGAPCDADDADRRADRQPSCGPPPASSASACTLSGTCAPKISRLRSPRSFASVPMR